MAEMSGGQAVVECIRRAGIARAFCVPGESFLAVLDAFYDHPDVQMIACRHEGGAGFMAVAYAQATGLPGIAMATRGPGLANLSIALHAAQQDSTPLVAFIGQVNTGFRHREAFQEVEITEYFRSMTKWQVEIRDAERTPELVQRALRTAISGRPGPVVVSLPEDVIKHTADMTFGEAAVSPRSRPSQDEVHQAAAILAGAGSVAILAGYGVLKAKATDQLVALADALGAPVFAAWRRFDVFPHQHPLYMGGASAGILKSVFDPFRQADVVLAVGTRLSEITTQGYTMPNPQQKLIHIDVSAEVIGSVFPPTVGMVADARLALDDLLEALPSHGGAEKAVVRHRAAAIARSHFVQTNTARPLYASPVDPEGIVFDLNRLLPADAVIVSDAGNFSGWINRYFRFRQPGTYFGSTSGAMGYSVPAAIGLKVAWPDRPVIGVAGDGGFTMTMNEVQTAVRLGLKGLVFLVYNNGMYGTIRAHQERSYPGRHVATDLGQLDFAMVAQGLGAHAQRVVANEQFPEALQQALTCGRPAVLELMIKVDRNSAWAQ